MIKYYESYDKKWYLYDSKLYFEQDSQSYEAKNSEKLDLNNPQDMCIGEIGDGCGGGRIFIADTGNGMIKVYEPEQAEVFIILSSIDTPRTISKKGCILFIESNSGDLEFDLSSMSLK